MILTLIGMVLAFRMRPEEKFDFGAEIYSIPA